MVSGIWVNDSFLVYFLQFVPSQQPPEVLAVGFKFQAAQKVRNFCSFSSFLTLLQAVFEWQCGPSKAVQC
jgi:hypothetical protein